ncbi:ubiquitin-conjugating enzyme/RWD-like protein [Tanacetum coccineum]
MLSSSRRRRNCRRVVRYHYAGLGISPNLTSSCGTVRLSLPKTNGDLEHVWVPGTSTSCLHTGSDFQLPPFFNGHKTVRMRGSVDEERYALLYSENTIRKTLKTMVYTMKNPPKNFEDWVIGNFRKHVRDILLACQVHINGQQVGCLEAQQFLYLSAKKTPVSAYEPPKDTFTLDVLEVPQGSGSGFVWDKKGHIVMNYHVIRGASDLRLVKFFLFTPSCPVDPESKLYYMELRNCSIALT